VSIVGVIQPSQYLRLVGEIDEPVGVFLKAVRQNLDGDIAPRASVSATPIPPSPIFHYLGVIAGSGASGGPPQVNISVNRRICSKVLRAIFIAGHFSPKFII
jgi:hypothetical protein